MKRCLNIGCGLKPTPSTPEEQWINLDKRALPDVDVVCDVRNGLPFDAESIDTIFVDNVLEHLDSEKAIFLLNEIGRVLVPHGTVTIIVPHALSQGAYQDPTHKSFWVPRSALYWSDAYTPYGGRAIGITADLVKAEEPIISGDMATEAFIIFHMKRLVVRPIFSEACNLQGPV